MTDTELDEDNRAGRRENVSGHAPFYTADSIDLQQIVDNIRIESDQRLIMGLGPCRVGTKAQLFTMAATGYDAFEQPMKAAYRCLGHDLEPEPFQPTDNTSYLKETIGPYTPGESLFNPLSILRRATGPNWCRDQLTIVILLRDPYDTWHSWRDVWGDRLDESTLYDNYVRAWQTTRDITSEALESDLDIVSFEYTLNKTPVEAYRRFFDRLNLDRTAVVDGWQQPDNRERLKTHFIKFREPDVFLPEGIRKNALTSEGLHYQSYQRDTINREDTITRDVKPIYEDCRKQLPEP